MDRKYIWQKTDPYLNKKEPEFIYLSAEMDKTICFSINIHHPEMWSKNVQWFDVINFTVSEFKVVK